jgi:hypothetical protein
MRADENSPSPNRLSTATETVSSASRALVLGIGGGGDVVGASAVARWCEDLGTPAELGGVAWERFAIDPKPGPRPLSEVRAARVIGACAALATVDTTTDDGIRFAESGMSAVIGRETALIDVTAGAAGAAEGIAAALEELGCDLVVLADIGGDAIANGTEPGLASPLCDAIMLAAGLELERRGTAVLGCVLGAGCDGELTPAEVLKRVAELAAAGAWIGTCSIDACSAELIERATTTVPTEASLMAAQCARGQVGPAAIRGGLRTVELTPVGALGLFFEVKRAIDAGLLPLAAAAAGSASLAEAHEALTARGVRTELAYELRRAAE